jgi:hypothetical protein
MQVVFTSGYILDAVVCGTSLVSGVFDSSSSGYITAQTIQGLADTPASNSQLSAPTRRFSIAVTTTIYLTVQANFTSGDAGAYGFIAARRVR